VASLGRGIRLVLVEPALGGPGVRFQLIYASRGRFQCGLERRSRGHELGALGDGPFQFAACLSCGCGLLGDRPFEHPHTVVALGQGAIQGVDGLLQRCARTLAIGLLFGTLSQCRAQCAHLFVESRDSRDALAQLRFQFALVPGVPGQTVFELCDARVPQFNVVFQRGEQFLEYGPAAFVGLQCLQVLGVEVACDVQVSLEAGDDLAVSGEPGFEVAVAGGQLRLEITAAARELRLDLSVVLDKSGMGIGIARLARFVRGLAFLQRLLQLRDASLRDGGGGFGSCHLIRERTGTVFGDVAFRDGQLERLLDLDQPLALACQALFDVTQGCRQRLKVDFEAGAVSSMTVLAASEALRKAGGGMCQVSVAVRGSRSVRSVGSNTVCRSGSGCRGHVGLVTSHVQNGQFGRDLEVGLFGWRRLALF